VKEIKLSEKAYFKLGWIPTGIGAVMDGWEFTEDEFLNSGLLNIEFRAFTHNCPLDCQYCFTNKTPNNLTGDEIKGILTQLKAQGARTINFVGEGEPSIDDGFMDVMSFCHEIGLKAVAFLGGSKKLMDRDFIRQLKKYNVTVVLKCDSLFNEEYQNKITNSKNGYFKMRNRILELLMEEGLNEPDSEGTTNLALNMIVTQFNKHEVLDTVKFGRENNIFVMACEFLPTGRSGNEGFDKNMMVSRDEMQKIRREIQEMDQSNYGFVHESFTSYTSVPCTIYGGIHIYGNGDVGRCAGDAAVLGNLRHESVAEIWNRIKLDKSGFHGHCPFRDRAYKS